MWSGTGSNTNNGGMGGMMGNGNTTSTSYLWIIPVILGAAVGFAVIGVAFYYAYPELKYIRGTKCDPTPSDKKFGAHSADQAAETSDPSTSNMNVQNVSNSCDVLLKTMTPEEKKVLDVLVAHQGKYLQKYVSKEAGLSRLKTHRIVARFAQRGIVSVKEFGNTNEIVVSDWLKR